MRCVASENCGLRCVKIESAPTLICRHVEPIQGLNCLSAEGLRRIMEAAPSLEDLSVAKESVLQRVKLDNTPESLVSPQQQR